jgi:hypothetical protein
MEGGTRLGSYGWATQQVGRVGKTSRQKVNKKTIINVLGQLIISIKSNQE